MSRMVAKFNAYYADKPTRKSGSSKNDFISIEIRDLDEKHSFAHEDLMSSKHLPPPFDFERLTRFMAFGFMVAPLQFKWFQFLSSAFPLAKGSATVATLKRVAFDQLIFAPITLASFFAFMTIAEGGGRRAVSRKLQDVYLPALKANYVVWPAIQILNFRVMPIQFQLPMVSTVSIAWTAYLSMTNSSDEL
ncbi:MAG: hypothetical protein M1833_005384 [Piccolia ochrophora]|nr:MAG: hypothetical protein M1833_005384 [Piccolia ochrophora]